MNMKMEKLTDAQIIELERWAEQKKKTNASSQEKQIIERIEGLKKHNWKGCRVDENHEIPTSKESAQKELEFLKLRQGTV